MKELLEGKHGRRGGVLLMLIGGAASVVGLGAMVRLSRSVEPGQRVPKLLV